jgi:hypothetical protein
MAASIHNTTFMRSPYLLRSSAIAVNGSRAAARFSTISAATTSGHGRM